MTGDYDLCPHCEGDVSREFVGNTQCMPAECCGCGAREFYSDEDILEATDVEAFTGWWLGENPDGLCEADLVRTSMAFVLMTSQDRKNIAARREQVAANVRQRQRQAEDREATRLRQQKLIDDALF